MSKKVLRTLQDDLVKFILCVGESLKEREEGNEYEVLNDQLESAFSNITPDFCKNLSCRFIIAYEPIWAIGTGLSASPSQLRKIILDWKHSQIH